MRFSPAANFPLALHSISRFQDLRMPCSRPITGGGFCAERVEGFHAVTTSALPLRQTDGHPMTLQLFKSVIDGLPYDYAQAVETHRQALLAHRFIGDAAPTAVALVEQAVRRVPREGAADDFVADYVIVDDTPPVPEVSDAERRQALVATVRQAEREASDAVIGPGKLRLLNLETSLVYGKPEDRRTPADDATLASYHAVRARLSAIEHHGATLEAQIDDLVPEQFDTWWLVPFPE